MGKRKYLAALGAAIAMSIGLLGCGGGSETATQNTAPLSYAQFKTSTPMTSEGIYIVEDDLPIYSDAELKNYYDAMVATTKGEQPAATKSPLKLVVNTQTSSYAGTVATLDNLWSEEHRQSLSYCIDNNFGWERKALVVTEMAKAAREWEKVANVHFIYKAAEDNNCTATNTNVLFSVKSVSGQVYLGMAFLPQTGSSFITFRSRRVLNLNGTAFTSRATPLSKTVAHEMGHILGFRHEWVDQPTATCPAESDARRVTPYDAASIMHYLSCNGGGSSNVLTNMDKQGATQLYGAPIIQSSEYASTEFTIKSLKTGKYVCSSDGAIVSCGDFDGTWERFAINQNSDGTVSLLAVVNAKYVTSGTQLTDKLHAGATQISDWEKFILISNTDGTVSLRSMRNDKYVSIPTSGEIPYDQLAAVATRIDTWEKFTIAKKLAPLQLSVNTDQNKLFSFQASSNGKYWMDQDHKVFAASSSVGNWEKFKVKQNLDGTISIWSQVNSSYLSVGFWDWVNSEPTTINTWEKFSYINNSDGSISFQSVKNNNYLSPASWSSTNLNAGSSSLSAAEKYRMYPAD